MTHQPNTALAPDIVEALKNDYAMRERGTYLRGGACPSCNKKELWTSTLHPWVIKCGRLNNCAFETTARDLYPALYQAISKRNPPTKDDPKATARAYLRDVRGLRTGSIESWYTQERFWHANANQGAHTVRFPIAGLDGVYMERLLDAVIITEDDGSKSQRKANFIGSHKGYWWQSPTFAAADGEAVYIVEGILDAISLIQAGQMAVAALSCSNYPIESLQRVPNAAKIKWIVAMDNDPAGRDATRKFVSRLRKAGYSAQAAIIPIKNSKTKRDWNDLWLAGELDTEHWITTLDECRYQGDLLLAATPQDKAFAMQKRKKLGAFWFEFDNRLFWFSYDAASIKRVADVATANNEDIDEADNFRRAGLTKEIANCYPECLYHEVSTVSDELNRYYLRVRTPDGRRTNAAFTSAQLSSSGEFKKRLLAISAGAMFLGGNSQLDTYLLSTLHRLQSIQVFDAAGYCDEHQAYVYHQFAVKDGKVFKVNDEDYISLGKVAVKTVSGLHLQIAEQVQKTQWLDWIGTAWGSQGIVATAYWMASLFAQQIRATHGSLPFFEITGEPGGGKSTLLEFLWKLFGRDSYEGFDPGKSSIAARSRIMAQASNLPIVLIESDRDDATNKRFSWDEFKTAYNGRSITSRGVKTGGNEVYEPPFRGALVISQNAKVEGSEAIMQRIVGINISRTGHSAATQAAATHCANAEVKEVSGVLLQALQKEAAIMSVFAKTVQEYRDWFAENGIKITRIALNHAQIAAFVAVLHQHFGLSKSAFDGAMHYLLQIAQERQDVVGDDPPTLIEFWELYEFLNGIGSGINPALNHSGEAREIAINLNHLTEVAGLHRLSVPPMRELKNLLKNSRRHKYLRQEVIRSNIFKHEGGSAKQVRCWIFTTNPTTTKRKD